jgi:hypothetical protein
MGIDNDKLIDLIATTLRDLPKQTFEVAWTNQEYEFCRIYQEDRVQIDGGTSIQRNVMLDQSGNASYRKLFDVDQPSVANVQTQINVPWTQIGTNYSWDIVEILRNRNSAKGYINLMESRRTDGLWSLADLIEDRAWKTPTNKTDTLYPYGVPYYLNFIQSGVVGGFVGQTINYQDATTDTVCAGIDASTQAKWRNYADVYAKVDNALLRKLRRAVMLTKFRPPLFIKSPGDDEVGTRVLYMDADTMIEMQDLADKRDDNTQPKDLAGKALIDVEGTVYFNRFPMRYIPNLDGFTVSSVAIAPIFMVDFKKFIPFVQDGFWMEESKPMTDRLQHTTITVYLDGSHNNLCLNRRTAGFVIHKQIA